LRAYARLLSSIIRMVSEIINLSKLLSEVKSYGDKLRYSKKSQGASTGTRHDLGPVVVWNATRACNLSCRHCYAGSDGSKNPEELTTEEARNFIDQLAALNVPVLLISGGEPLLRPDLEKLIKQAVAFGIRVTLSTNGTLITPERAGRFKELGVSYVGISIDGLPETHNHFRGEENAFDRALAGIKNCQQVGQKVGLRFTLTAFNRDEIPAVFDLLLEENIARLCFYHLVHQGRGSTLNEAALSSKETREVLDYIISRSDRLPQEHGEKEILTVANHVDGIYLYLKLREAGDPRAERILQYLKYNGGNRSGTALACVDWKGSVHPDQFSMNHNLGNIREETLKRIWHSADSGLLKKLRNRKRHLQGRCADCSWLSVCNGNFRARAEAATGEYWAEDPGCYLTAAELSRGGSVFENNPHREAADNA